MQTSFCLQFLWRFDQLWCATLRYALLCYAKVFRLCARMLRCVKLLATLLAYNPYDVTLDLEVNKQRLDRAEAELLAMAPLLPAPFTIPVSDDGDTPALRENDGEKTNTVQPCTPPTI